MNEPLPDTEIITEEPAPEPAPEGATEPVSEPETFSREYVAILRAEAAEARVRAKVTDHANTALLAAYAGADGRLVDVEVLPMTDDLIGEDGLVSQARVTNRIGEVLAVKPYLQARKATALPMGVRADPPAEVGWLDVLRGTR